MMPTIDRALYYDSSATTAISNWTAAVSTHIWTLWQDMGTQTSTTDSSVWWTNAASTAVWSNWTSSDTSFSITQPVPTFRQMTLEERQEQLRRQERAAARRRQEEVRWQAEVVAREKAALAAAERAKALLVQCLNPEQRMDLEESGSFYVTTKNGNRYLIRRGWAGNVFKIEKHMRTEALCIHPREQVPEYDNMLAQKLLLEADEKAFRQTANISRYSQPRAIAS